jgi:hypothetical protein
MGVVSLFSEPSSFSIPLRDEAGHELAVTKVTLTASLSPAAPAD